MFYHDGKLQYKVRVDKPNPAFANMLQQAIGGIEGEIRVCLQYLFQAWGSRGPKKYRDMLMETGTEEIAHIEMLATAVALNLEGAPMSMKDEMAKDSVIGAVMGGMNPRHVLSSGLAALAVDSNGVPFNGSWVVGSGNLAADMYANVQAESTGRTLATRLWEATDDHGMKDMLAFLIARDTMHQNQWLAVLEELGGLNGVHPIPNSFPQTEENKNFNYAFVSTKVNDLEDDANEMMNSRWASGPSMDGKGEFKFKRAMPEGGEPQLGPPDPRGHAQTEQMTGSMGAGMINKIKDAL
ncbi:manganese catalase family protein [Pontibacter silvestris]|uniref:Manganese catalase family protein n=1 Tax=Pontibacter silvestris TaxID=2305183 RepID=A0ABW4X2H8_9BACT|nr:manganese catalase family protein [Pontibacter silvestris]MCC9135945.1 manganese catalase family protein [Pontibacter silvestris]